jgi:hypothetical protein
VLALATALAVDYQCIDSILVPSWVEMMRVILLKT